MADFVFTITTTSPNETFTLPLESGGSYDFNVDWGDTTDDDITAWDDAAKTHTYATPNTYTVTIDFGVSGELVGWRFNNNADASKIRDIGAWGDLRLGNNGGYFYGCSGLTISAADTLDLTGTTNLSSAFRNCTALATNAAMDSWDVSAVTNMSYMFMYCVNFNQDIGSWNVSSVTDTQYMFMYCTAFNQDIGSWNVSSVANMQYMFMNCTAFNSNIGSWDVSAATNIYALFYGCATFNQDIGSWDVSAVTSTGFGYLFFNCAAFNQDISGWNVAASTFMAYMFYGCAAFNQDISSWDVSAVTNMSYMFHGCIDFDQNLGDWDVSAVTDMTSMFYGCTLTPANYNLILLGWSSLATPTVREDVPFHAGFSKYSGTGADARFILTDTYSWSIIDGGIEPAALLDSIRERIILALISNLADITTERGFLTDIGKNVQRVKLGLTENELPALVIWPQVEEATKILGKTRIVMPVKLEGLSTFTNVQNLSVIAELMLSDIRRKMEAQGSTNNVTDGLADSIEYSAGGTDEYPEPGHDRIGVYAVYNITYKTVAGDPYSQ